MTTTPDPDTQVREVRDELAQVALKFDMLARAGIHRRICRDTYEQIGEVLCDLDGWMGWDED